MQGNLGDCVTVDGNSTSCGTSSSGTLTYADMETPGGLINSNNASYSLAFTPGPAASLLLYRNGLLMSPGIDFTLATNQITFLTPSVPQTGDSLTASYRYTPPGPIIGRQTIQNAPQVLCNGIGSSTASTQSAILGTCNIAANKLASGDRVEIKFGFTHQGAAAGFNPAIYWGGTGLVLRAMTASDTAITGEADVIVANDGTLVHFTSSAASAGLSLITAGLVAGNIQNPNTVSFDASLARSGTSDSVTLNFYIITRYPAPQ